MIEIYAHRGSSGSYPENTMIAFREAERAGADGIEFDVQMSKDDELVVIHDEKVNRTTNGKGWVREHTLKELKQLNAGVKTKRHESIPTFEEVLAWAQDSALKLNIELKTGLIPYAGIEEKLVEYIHRYGLSDRVIVSSFNHYSVEKIHKINPELETAILFMEALFEPWKYAKSIGASGLHGYWKIATPELIHDAHAAGMAFRPFTVNRNA
ncbi:MAG TPA: glycerophosphodiester phosphodiesterase, partial [Bacillales bacterium]|nr:glycerophosphodiester phosphodiesterase [Bacillales bacterium]